MIDSKPTLPVIRLEATQRSQLNQNITTMLLQSTILLVKDIKHSRQNIPNTIASRNTIMTKAIAKCLSSITTTIQTTTLQEVSGEKRMTLDLKYY